jgi:hypothetical protein
VLHVILDNLNTHKPRNDRWLRRHPNVHFHFTPTRASWLNQVEIWWEPRAASFKGCALTPREHARYGARAIRAIVEERHGRAQKPN